MPNPIVDTLTHKFKIHFGDWDIRGEMEISGEDKKLSYKVIPPIVLREDVHTALDVLFRAIKTFHDVCGEPFDELTIEPK